MFRFFSEQCSRKAIRIFQPVAETLCMAIRLDKADRRWNPDVLWVEIAGNDLVDRARNVVVQY
jgi:hypothetical protein